MNRGDDMTTLKQGSRGSEVKQLQTQLKNLGYNVGSIDGIFGPKTLAAVKAFQKDRGLSVDGIVGKKTWGALKTSSTSKSSTTPKTTPKASSSAPTVPKIEPFKPDTSKQPQTPTIEPFKPDTSNIPKAPEIKPPPQIEEFNPNIDRAKLQQEALDLLLPQYQRGQEQLQELYTQNLQRINDETLKRGLARSSYVGDRQDRETSEHGKRLLDLERDYNEQANLLAYQQYDKEWDRQYQLHRDKVGDTWRAYTVDVDNAWRQYQADMDRYRLDLDTQWKVYSSNVDNAWREYGALMDLYKIDLDNQRLAYQTAVDTAWRNYDAQYKQYRDTISDKQWQEQFDWQKHMDKERFDWQKYMDKEQLKLAKTKASSGGGSRGSSSRKSSKSQGPDPYSVAYNDILNSSDPFARFNQIRGQLAMAGLSQAQIDTLHALAAAESARRKPQKTGGSGTIGSARSSQARYHVTR